MKREHEGQFDVMVQPFKLVRELSPSNSKGGSAIEAAVLLLHVTLINRLSKTPAVICDSDDFIIEPEKFQKALRAWIDIVKKEIGEKLGEISIPVQSCISIFWADALISGDSNG
jgi:hypothetical protein